MYDMFGATLLSAGSKAKTRDSSGVTYIIERYYANGGYMWVVGWIGSSGKSAAYGCGASYSRVEEFAKDHRLDLKEHIWLPVEARWERDDTMVEGG